jgi:flagellar biosynthesis/type III secretory pathway protein FliH
VHVTPVSRFSVAGLLLVCTTLLLAQERHLGKSPGADLFTRSSFAHGYMHGYEEGFHGGDLDVQLGRDPRDPASLATYKKIDCYQKDFGPREPFKVGFEDGFRAGYSDAVRLRPFSAVASLKEAAQGLSEAKTKKDLVAFDDGFREGYKRGRHQGASDGRDAAENNPIVPPCLGLPDEYCEGFHRAFVVGYADGYSNQSPAKPKTPVQVASGQ